MYTKQKFLDRLKELMYEKSITFIELSKKTGINERTIRRWYEERSPKIESLVKLANYFQCSIDYLIGINDTEFDFQAKTNNIAFTKRYLQLKKSQHLLDARIAEYCNTSSATVSRWSHGTIPNFEVIVELCKLFSCSYEYIVERVD